MASMMIVIRLQKMAQMPTGMAMEAMWIAMTMIRRSIPGAAEVCDGIDNNCDGRIDEGLGITIYADADGDGYGDANTSMVSCSAPTGFVTDTTDCDDTNANINPGASEILYNGIDDDCDPATEDGTDATAMAMEVMWIAMTMILRSIRAIEVCDGIDNNCDGSVDEGLGITFYADAMVTATAIQIILGWLAQRHPDL